MYSNACKIVEMPAAMSSSIVEASTCQGQKARVPIFHAIQSCRAILCYIVVNFHIADLLLTDFQRVNTDQLPISFRKKIALLIAKIN